MSALAAPARQVAKRKTRKPSGHVFVMRHLAKGFPDARIVAEASNTVYEDRWRGTQRR